MVSKVKKFISIAFVVVVMMLGTLASPPQGLAEDLPVTSPNTISGTISLPLDAVIPSEGLEGEVQIEPENGGQTYFTPLYIPAGSHSLEYTLTVPEAAYGSKYYVQYLLYYEYPGFVGAGYYSPSGTTTNREAATLFDVNLGNLTGINLMIHTGRTISGTISLPSDAVVPSEGLEGKVEIEPENGGSTYNTPLSIPADSHSVNYTITVPEEAYSSNYYVRYYLYNDYPGFDGEGYYSPDGTKADYQSATLIQVNNGNLTGIDLNITLLPPNPDETSDDHGNTIASATEINAGVNVSGVIETAGDMDFFKFTPTNTGNYTITTISDQDTYGYLFDANGNQLAEDNDELDANFLINQDLQEGQAYYIEVKLNSPLQIGNYQLRVMDNSTTSVPVSQVNLNKSGLNLMVGQDELLTATIMPDNATNKRLKWTVSNESQSGIVTLSEFGTDSVIVTAMNAGTAVIRAASNSDPTKYAETNVTVENGKIISGTISLPEGVTAPSSGIMGQIFADSKNGGMTYKRFIIPEGSSTENYTLFLPEDASDTGYRVGYSLSNNDQYAIEGFYSIEGTTNNDSATLINLSNGRASDVNLTIVTINKISGVISLPQSVPTPTAVNVHVEVQAGSENFGTNVTIPAESASVNYTINVPAYNVGYSVGYFLNDYYPGYLNSGYYSINGTTNSKSASPINVSDGNADGVNFTLLTGTEMSGTISLPGVIPAAQGVSGYVTLEPRDGSEDYRAYFTIPGGELSAGYNLTVPTDNSIEYRLRYTLYYSDNPDYLGEGYYSANGTTNYASSSWINLTQGNLSELNLTILTGHTISGTFSLPNSETAPDGGINGEIEITPEYGNSNYTESFNILTGDNSANFSVRVPADASFAGYRVNYRIYTEINNYVKTGYYSSSGTTTLNNSTLVNVMEGNVSDINLVSLEGHTISGMISLQNGAAAPAGGIVGFVRVSLPTDDDASPVGAGGGGTGGGAPAPTAPSGGLNYSSLTEGFAADKDDNFYFANFYIPEGKNFASYTTESIPVDAIITGYRVNYELYGNSDYVSTGYYSVAGTTTSDSASLVNINAGNLENIDLTLLTGNIISGTISLPENASADYQSIMARVYAEPINGGNSYYQYCAISSGAAPTNYSIIVPADTSITGYRVGYDLEEHGSEDFGFVSEGYYSSDGTTTFKSATLINANAGNTNNVNLTILMGNAITGTISLPAGMTAPPEGIDVTVNVDSLDGGKPYSTDLYIRRGRTSEGYTVNVPVDTTIAGYRVSYKLYEDYLGYQKEGYYSTTGTTGSADSATLVGANTGNACNIDLTMLTGNILPSKISLNQSNVQLMPGQTEQLIATIMPSYAADKTVTWTVSSESASNTVTLSNNETNSVQITAMNAGTAVIRAASNSDPTIYAEATITVVKVKTISGTISLPGDEKAPFGGIAGDINAYSQYGGGASVPFIIPEGSSSVDYTVILPENASTTGYQVSYWQSSNNEYIYQGYYSTEGTTSYQSATIVNLNDGSAPGINLTLVGKHLISGTISLPTGITAPAGGISVDINIDCGGYGYGTSVVIPEDQNSASYSSIVPAFNGYRISYALRDNLSGYLRVGYYSASGTTDSNSATLVNVREGNADGVNLTILTGTVISGTISLPEGATALNGMLDGNIYIEPDNGDNDYQVYFTIPVLGNSASYSVTVPTDNSTRYRVRYYLYNDHDYLGEGYYSTNGTTNFNSATLLSSNQGNLTNINMTLQTGNTISGTFSLPVGETAPLNGLRGGITISPEYSGRSYFTDFNILEGKSSASYSVRVPVDASMEGYHVSYNLYDNYSNYVRNGYYSTSGTTTSNNATLVSVLGGNASNINLTPLTGHTISGTISLTNGSAAPEKIQGSIYVSLPNDNGTSSGGGGTAVGANGDKFRYYANFEILPGENFVRFTTESIPVDPTISGYLVNYKLNNYPDYVSAGYYSETGTTNSKLATLVNVNAGSLDNINLTLLAGNTISGTISLPNNATVTNKPIFGEVCLKPQDGGTGYYQNIFIPMGAGSADYSIRVPVDTSISGYLVNYSLFDNYGYVGEGYYSDSGTTTSKSASLVNADSGDVKDINLTLLTGNTISGMISLPNGVSAPSGGIEYTVSADPLDGGNSYTTNYYIEAGRTSAGYTVTVPVDAATPGYRVSYTLRQYHPGFLEQGYYAGAGKTTLNPNSFALVDTNAGNASNINLTLLMEGFSAAPAAKIGVNHNAGGSAGMFIGLKNIVDSLNPELQDFSIGGYQIDVTFDPSQVSIPDVLDLTNSGGLFSKKIERVDGIGTVHVACATSGNIKSYDKLFFIPITLTGSAHDISSISVKYVTVRDTALHKIQIPTLENLTIQRGKIYNGEAGDPSIADAVAGLQYLSMLRNPGRGPEEVNLVNMASITESGDTNVAKPSVKDVIALMQRTVHLRDDYFMNLPTE